MPAPLVTLRDRAAHDRSAQVVPSYDDPVVRGAVELLGGPPGRHARLDRRWWTPVRVLLVLTLLTSGLGWAQKAPCRNGSSWVHEFQYTRGCYTDVVALYDAEGLSAGRVPYLQHPVEYPVLIGAAMGAGALAADALQRAFPDDATRRALHTPGAAARASAVSYARADARGRHFYDATWFLLTLCALVVTVTTARLSGRRPWDAALFALSPALALHGTTNWDLLAVALAGAGLLLWARSRPLAAGILLGLGTAAKLYPVLFLVPLLLLCLRARRLAAWRTTAAALLLTTAAVTLPVYLASPSYAVSGGSQVELAGSPLSRLAGEGLSALAPHTTVAGQTGVNGVYRFVQLNSDRGADWDSLYLQVAHLHVPDPVTPVQRLRNGLSALLDALGLLPGSSVTHLNVLVALSFLLCLAALVLLVRRAPRRPRVPQVLFLTLVAFLLTGKVHSPQYVLWLVPLAVLAHPRWRPFLVWQATEALVLLGRFLFFVGNDKPGQGVPISWFFSAVLVRDLALLGYVALVVRDVLHPDRDVVRADGVDDPAGGVLDGAPDPALPTGHPRDRGRPGPGGPGGTGPGGPGGPGPGAPARVTG